LDIDPYANSSPGPSIVEKQDEWIIGVLNKMRDQGKTRIVANEDVEQEWKKTINSLHSLSLRDKVVSDEMICATPRGNADERQDGWYMGTNIPGTADNLP
jgi:hypothetical protein